MSAAAATRRGRQSRRPSLRVVESPAPRHTLIYSLLLVLLSSAAVFGTVTFGALGAGSSVEARQLERQVAVAERRYAELVAEVARLEDPARIEAEALSGLGMVRPEETRFVFVSRPLPDDGQQVADVAAGAPADPMKPILSAAR
jgi:cell division protein FtsB